MPDFAPTLVRRVGLGVLAAALLVIPETASAQYFGRNKVHYETFRFRVLATEHFDIHYYDEEKAVAELAGRMAERWYGRLSVALDHDLRGRQPLIVYASHPDFEQTNAIPGHLDESTGGVTESFKRRIVLPLGPSLSGFDHVLGHELVHAFQFDMRRRGQSNLVETGLQMPLWFVEGMAEYLSVGPVDPHTTMWMRDAARAGKLPTIAKLDQFQYFPYRFGQALWAFVAGQYGEGRVAEIYKSAARGISVDRAFEAVLGISADSLSRDWQRATRDWADAPRAAVSVEPPRAIADTAGAGRLLLGPRGDRGRLNVSPSLSPDGSRVAFLSERDAFSIELFVADAVSGRVLRRLTRAALDPHLQSLQFIQSSGAWSPDGRRIAVATVNRGQPALAIIDASNGRTLNRIRLRDLGEVYHPTWSRDGTRLAFSGLAGGMTDLFIVEVASRKVTRITEDLYADLQPSWSPDGRSIAFSTDRFTTHLEDLEYGDLQLATIEVEGGAITPLPGADQGKNINPQWSKDGKSLYFISDRGGISNVYRLEPANGSVAQVTDVATGVSGITAASPALSVARAADRLVFSVFENGNYRIHALDGAAVAGTQPRPAPANAGTLPTAIGDASATATSTVPGDTLADAEKFRREKYRAGLSLDSVGQLGIGVAAGGGGVAFGGGSALYWSDMLGDHNLATQFQVSNAEGGLARNLAATASYTNLRHRWNWGLMLGQVPYFSRSFEYQEDFGNGIAISRDTRYWEIDRRVQGIIAYPLSRAQRVELGGGYRNLDFVSEIQTQTYDLVTGRLLTDITRAGPDDTLSSLNLFEGLVALVYDNSLFGGTSPIFGQRYRFEVAPVSGDLDYTGVLGDYRQYLRLGGPLTLAVRGMHVGRYGPDSETDRIQSLFIGYPWLVRGYDAESFSVAECGGGNGGDCPAYDQLFGSRAAVGNLELRLPLLGALGLIPSPMAPPIEAAAFYDHGVAWTDTDKARFLGGTRRDVSSYGGTMRVNLLGFAVAEISYVHPNERPLKGWYWLFAFQPGF